MREYKVINSFVERDEHGNPTGVKIHPPATVQLTEREAKRLMKANCVIETAMNGTTERRRRGRPRKSEDIEEKEG